MGIDGSISIPRGGKDGMGIPNNYSADLPERLGLLLGKLYPIVKTGWCDDKKFGGDLGTTFLLAVATPLITLPTERVLKPLKQKAFVSDLNENISRKFKKIFDAKMTFGASPFSSEGWSHIANTKAFNLGGAWPRATLEELNSKEAYEAAGSADMRQFIFVLRNALSHGGISYLDKTGQQTMGNRAESIGFVSASKRSGAFSILRASESGFREFLTLWASWLAY